MTTLKPYPAYADTDLLWLGQIPAHWGIMSLKRLVELVTGNTPPKADESNYEDGTILWVKPDNLNGTIPINDSVEKLTLGGSKQARVIPAGSALVCCIGTVGKVGVAGHDLATNQQINSVIFSHPNKWLPSYGIYALIASEEEHSRRSNKVVVAILNKTAQGEIKFPIPSLSEQQAIAAYLDRQTAKIDTLIAKKQRLLDLLAEQRAVLIIQAVTKGLNPTVKMKDSGVAWLGQVPSHWEVEKNKHIYNEIDDRSEYGDEELLTVSHITGVTTRAEKEVNMFMAETLEGYKRCRAGDLAINTMWAWMGALGISPLDGVVSPSYNIYRFRNQKDFLPKFLDYLYRTPQHIMEIKRYSKGIWSSRLRLYPDEFMQMSTPKPPYEEQVQIVEFLDKRLTQMNNLASKVEAAIELQQEYRAALISSVVTGKVQVSEL